MKIGTLESVQSHNQCQRRKKCPALASLARAKFRLAANGLGWQLEEPRIDQHFAERGSSPRANLRLALHSESLRGHDHESSLAQLGT
jgi:hypothetical protein